MSNPNEIAKVLEDAATRIEKNGWWNGKGRRWPDEVCALTAFIRDLPNADASIEAAMFELATEIMPNIVFYNGSYVNYIIRWNDSQTSAYPIIRTMRKIAKRLRKNAQREAQAARRAQRAAE